MKKYFYIILSFVSILKTHSAGLLADHSVDYKSQSDFAKTSDRLFRRQQSNPPSEIGSVGSLHSTKSYPTYNVREDLELLSYDELIDEYSKLLNTYKKAGEESKDAATRKSRRIDLFLQEQLITLSSIPGVLENFEDGKSKNDTLRKGIKTLVNMYKMLEQRSTTSSAVSVGTEPALENDGFMDDATIAALTARTAELEETINQLERKPETTETGTDFSPERRIVFSSPARLKRTAETVAKQSEELVALKSEIAELRAQQVAVDLEKASDAKEIEALHLHNSELEVEIQRLKTENASLKAAQKAAESSAKLRASTSEDNVRTPLLATGATSSKQNGGQGCPCSIM